MYDLINIYQMVNFFHSNLDIFYLVMLGTLYVRHARGLKTDRKLKKICSLLNISRVLMPATELPCSLSSGLHTAMASS